jgi:predicted metal-dependent hydrolase
MARETDIEAFQKSNTQDQIREQIRRTMEYDGVQRTNTRMALEDFYSNQINEELQIRVQNFDKNTVVMWTIE